MSNAYSQRRVLLPDVLQRTTENAGEARDQQSVRRHVPVRLHLPAVPGGTGPDVSPDDGRDARRAVRGCPGSTSPTPPKESRSRSRTPIGRRLPWFRPWLLRHVTEAHTVQVPDRARPWPGQRHRSPLHRRRRHRRRISMSVSPPGSSGTGSMRIRSQVSSTASSSALVALRDLQPHRGGYLYDNVETITRLTPARSHCLRRS